MHIIKLDATDSTNLYLKNLALSGSCEDLTVVSAVAQIKGRGQRGNVWTSEPGKNLTFSILKKLDGFFVNNQFQLNIAVSLAIFETLDSLKVPRLKIKWPNDILSGTFKLSGILIENLLQGDQIRHTIIGIGLNVNQTRFHKLSNATSLKLLLGDTLNLEALFDELLEKLAHYLNRLETNGIKDLSKTYGNLLFMNGEHAIFQRPDGQTFRGLIRGVSPNGRLRVFKGDGVLEEFDSKEIRLLY